MIHLRVRTEFSFRETFAPLPRVVERLKAVGATSAGIVDRAGSTWGHVRWERALLESGLTPLFGLEVNVGREPPGAPAWALALGNPSALYELGSRAHLQGAAGGSGPFLTADQFLGAAGLVRFTGAALSSGLDPGAAADAGCWFDINPGSLLGTGKTLSAARRVAPGRVVLTGDNFFPAPQDRKIHELSGRVAKPTPQHILSRGELEAFGAAAGMTPEGVRAAMENAERIVAEIGECRLTRAPLIKVEGDVESLCRSGQQRRLAAGQIATWTDDYEQRLQRELALVREKEFESYFLVVADMVRWAKQRMLVGPARGSAAGSLMCYLLGITEVDPLPYGLLFERFVDVTRTDLPDIDLDFPDAKRDSVYEYLRQTYGADHVARIGTVSEYKPKSALGEVAKRLGIPPWETRAVKDAMFTRSSGDSRANNCLTDTLTDTAPGIALVEKFPAITLAGEIEGHASHAGVHAAGVIVCNEPITNFCTVVDGVAQLDKIDAEALNLLKIDALGLRTLSVIEDAGVVTQEQMYAMRFDDPAVYELLNAGRFSGIFQWEGRALQSLTSLINMSKFEDMVHITALARPGPLGGGAATKFIERHAGRERPEVAHDSMWPYLKETYGLVLYQEQVMRIARDIGQLTWKDTSDLRKAMSKSYGKEYFDKYAERFIEGAKTALGMNKREALSIWDQVNSHGSWCLSGATLVKMAHSGSAIASWMRIDELYARYVESPSPWIKQRRSMPVLYSVHPNGRAYPHQAITIYKNGDKRCNRYTFSDGTEIVCTADHLFVINERWRHAGEARIGDGWLMAEYDAPQPSVNGREGKGSAARGNHWRFENGRHISPSEINRRSPIYTAFVATHRGKRCEDCNCRATRRMEAHHNDFNSGRDRPDDLSWLCAGCHKKRHYAAGRTKRNEKGMRLAWKELIAINDAGVVETYDIEMEKHHNFIINGGIVTHNSFNKSHAASYGMISYWTAWLKAHHPLQYAAASLRNAKDDEAAFNMLREIVAEGIEYVPFDPERSEMNWSVQDGKLIGGFLGLKGVGPATALAMLNARSNGGLSDKQKEKLEKAKLIFADLYPAHTQWGQYYDKGVVTVNGRKERAINIADFPPDGGHVLFIGQLKQKDARDKNESVLLHKRNGKRIRGSTAFLDLRVIDDTTLSPILCRIDVYDYEPVGRLILERGREDHDWFLIRGEKLRNFPMVQVHKIRCLNDPELLREQRTERKEQ